MDDILYAPWRDEYIMNKEILQFLLSFTDNTRLVDIGFIDIISVDRY